MCLLSLHAADKNKTPRWVSPAGLLLFSSRFCYFALTHLSAGDRPVEIGELGRVAYLRDHPRFRPKSSGRLFLDASADWRRPEGDRVTSLCHSNEVLPPVLAEEKPFFTLEQACQVQAAYRHIDLEFHLLCFLSCLTSLSRTA